MNRARSGATCNHNRLLFRASPPVKWNELMTAGLLAHGLASSPDLPAMLIRSGMTLEKNAKGLDNPLTVAGAATASGLKALTVFPIIPCDCSLETVPAR